MWCWGQGYGGSPVYWPRMGLILLVIQILRDVSILAAIGHRFIAKKQENLKC